MKYRPEEYGRALAEAILAGEAKEDAIRKNFLALVEKNGDMPQFARSIAHAEKVLRAKSGERKLTLETARPLTSAARKELAKVIQPSDAVEEKLNPELVAGVRITVNDELQWDGSLARKIQKLFAYK